MPLKIRYSPRAREEEIEILEYILKEFGQKKAREIFDGIEDIFRKIAEMPYMFPASQKLKGVRRCVFSKQMSIYYRVSKDYVEVISFRDNRKDPEGLSGS